MKHPERSEHRWYELIVTDEKTNSKYKFENNDYPCLEQAVKDIDNPKLKDKKRCIVLVTETRELVVEEKDPVKKPSSSEIREALKKALYIVSNNGGTQYIPHNIHEATFSIPVTPVTSVTYVFEDCFVEDGYVFFKRKGAWYNNTPHDDNRCGFKIVGSLF